MGRFVHGNFKSLLRRLPESVAEEIRAQHHETGKMLLARAQARVPTRTGKLKAGLSYKVLPKSLRLKVGIIGKPLNRKLYYGRWVEWGRKASSRIVTRKGTLQRARAAGLNVRANRYKVAALKAGISGAYRLRTPALPPRHFVINVKRALIYLPYQKIWGRAIHRAAAGAGDG